METVGLISLGCARNLVDSEVMLGSLRRAGFHISKDPADCEIIIVNTCGFIEASKKESIDTVLEMATFKKKGRLKKLIMAGCLSQRYSGELSKTLPEVDLFIGTGEFPRIVELLGIEKRDAVGKPRALVDETLPRELATPKHYAYLKLAEGCQHACSFCIIPKLRGPLRSRSVESLAIETERLIAQGVKEFNLIAQDSTGYGQDRKDGTTLRRLLERLTNIPGEKWFRLFYAYPHGFPMEVVELMRDRPQICNYLDLPIQHMSDRLLKSMRREGGSRDIRELIASVRKLIPDITLRTTCIVGYPSETEQEFKKLLAFIAEGHFDHVGVFTYSHEEGTTAGRLTDDVPQKLKMERRKQLMRVQQKISREKNERWLGKKIRVLVDGTFQKNGLLQARHEGQAPDVDGAIYIKDGIVSAGTFAVVEITEAREYDLVGRLPKD